MDTIQPHTDVSTATPRSTGRIVLGLLFLLPALFCCITQLVLPTVSTLLMSFQKVDLFGAGNEYVGLDNYVRLFGDKRFGQAAGFTLVTLLVRLFVVALVPLLLAWAAGQLGRSLRVGLRILLTLPVVLFAPVAIAVTWMMFLNPTTGGLPFEVAWTASPASARTTLLFVDALYLFGLASGLGLMAYLPLWRRPADASQPTFREAAKPMLATWAVGILGISALTLSTFTLNRVLTNGGPLTSTTTLGMLVYQFAFLRFQIGPAAAVASLILLVTLVLGTVAGFVIVLTRLRLNVVDAKPAPETADPSMPVKRSLALPGIVFALLGLLTLVICLVAALPFGWLIPQAFGNGGMEDPLGQVSAVPVLINTLVPALIAATLQVLVAYLAALGIGALRPFGKRSEWLLLLFSPWLFVTVLPLSLVNFIAAQKAEMLDTFAGSLSPILFSIPAFFILTLFFAGRASQRGDGSGETTNFFRHFVLPSLPLAAILWLALIFFNGQDVFWSLLIAQSPERWSLNVALLQVLGLYAGGAQGVLAAAITFFVLPLGVLFFICLALFQIFTLDRLALYAESSSSGEV